MSKKAAATADTDPLAVWSTLVAVYQAVLHDVVQALGDQAGMDSGVFSALAYLERAEPSHRIRMSELQSLMHPRYSQPGFSRLVQRMEADGLVGRRADPADRRAAILATTQLGRRSYDRANAVYRAAVEEHFGRHLTVGEGADITRALAKVEQRRRALTT